MKKFNIYSNCKKDRMFYSLFVDDIFRYHRRRSSVLFHSLSLLTVKFKLSQFTLNNCREISWQHSIMRRRLRRPRCDLISSVVFRTLLAGAVIFITLSIHTKSTLLIRRFVMSWKIQHRGKKSAPFDHHLRECVADSLWFSCALLAHIRRGSPAHQIVLW